MSDAHICACGKPARSRCSRCLVEWYCGRECQKKAWKSHKTECRHAQMKVFGIKWLDLPEHYDSVEEELDAIRVFAQKNPFQDYQFMKPLVCRIEEEFGINYTIDMHKIVAEIYENIHDEKKIRAIAEKNFATKAELQFICYAITHASPCRAIKFTISMARSILETSFDGLYGFQR